MLIKIMAKCFNNKNSNSINKVNCVKTEDIFISFSILNNSWNDYVLTMSTGLST